MSRTSEARVAAAERGMAVALLLFLLAGQAVRNALGWHGFVVVTLVLTVLVGARLWRMRRDPRLLQLPAELIAFLAFCAASVLWSHYQWATTIGLLAQWATTLAGVGLALTLTWSRLLSCLATALVWILGLSLAFEAFVAFVVRSRVPPLWTDVGRNAPGAFYWSENHLLTGGPIQGIVGNRNLLAFLALLAVLVLVAVIARDGRVRVRTAAALALAVVVIGLTRSATVLMIAVMLVGLFALIRVLRRVAPALRNLAYTAVWFLLAMACGLAVAFLDPLLRLIGRSDLTNREDIWRAVLGLVEQRPVFGWGWVSYWAPWVHPYDGLVVIDGVEYLQAHNALLDVWLQLGVFGALLAVGAAAAALVRAWRAAVHPAAVCAVRGEPGLAGGAPVPGWFPLLLLAALLAQGMTESRLLIEGNWALFVIVSISLAIDRQDAATQLMQVPGIGRPLRSARAATVHAPLGVDSPAGRNAPAA